MWRVVPVLCLVACAPPLTDFEREQLEAMRLPDVPTASEDMLDPARAELGRLLFYDCGLSTVLQVSGPQGEAGEGRRVACASCHEPLRGGADVEGVRFSHGVGGLAGRNAPTLWNAGERHLFGWEGGYEEMWDLIRNVPLVKGPHKMTAEDVQNRVVQRWSLEYEAAFRTTPAWEDPATVLDHSAMAIEAFVHTLRDGNSAFDAFIDPVNPDPDALSDDALLGARLFVGKAACVGCHDGPILSDGEFHNLGLGDDDLGRFNVSEVEVDQGSFQTPMLRNAGRTAPYMHDGSIAQLWDVVDFYNTGGGEGAHIGRRDGRVANLGLSEDEIDAIVAFVESLDGTPPDYLDLPPAGRCF